MNWNKYPYTDFHELNLDWILTMIKDLNIAMDSFVNVNTIKYADPLLWNITTQYEQNTLVQDADGNTYLSKKAVPTGIAITNEDYWLKVADFSGTADVIRDSIAHANDEASTTTSADRFTGDLVWLSGYLFQVVRDMNIGDAYIKDGDNPNVLNVTVEELLNNIKSALDTEILNLTTEVDDLTNALNTETTEREQAISAETTAREQAISAETTAREQAISAETTAREQAISAETTAREQADSVIDGRLDELETKISQIGTVKKVVFIGDSYGLSPSANDNWIESCASLLGLSMGVNAFKYAEGGASFGGTTGYPLFQNMINTVQVSIPESEITDVIVCGGFNDIVGGDHGATESNTLAGIQLFVNRAKARFVNAKVHIGYIAWSKRSNLYIVSQQCCGTYINGAATYGANYLNNVQYAFHFDKWFVEGDLVHPNSTGSLEIAKAVANAFKTGSANVTRTYANAEITFNAGISNLSGSWFVGTIQDNGLVGINMFYNSPATRLKFDNLFSTNQTYDLGTISNTYALGDSYSTCSIAMECYISDVTATDWNPATVTFTIQDGHIYMHVRTVEVQASMQYLDVMSRTSFSVPTLLV